MLIDRFGPPAVEMRSTHAERPDGPRFDHAEWSALVGKHVREGGFVDYPGFALDASTLDDYLARLAAAEFDALGRREKLALLINAYNAFTVRLILDHGGGEGRLESIPEADRWDAVRWTVGGAPSA